MLFLVVFLSGIMVMVVIELNNYQVRNMDDVCSLGVIYINYNFVMESEVNLVLNEEVDV